jgi:hypothetical protein
MNPFALSFWCFMFLVGYLSSGVNTGLVMLSIAIGISLIAGVYCAFKGIK